MTGERREARGQKKKLNTFDLYQSVLRKWAVDLPADMKNEPARERLLDAMLRLFEALSAAGLRQNFKSLKPDWPNIQKYYPPLLHAMRWQLTALNLPLPTSMVPLAARLLSLAALRGFAVWVKDETAGQSRLMAAIDRDLDRINAAVQYIVHLRNA